MTVASSGDSPGVLNSCPTPDQVRKASVSLREAISGREAQLSQLAGRSALDRFAGRIVADWDTFDVEDKRAVLLSLVSHVTVRPTSGGALADSGGHRAAGSGPARRGGVT